MSKKKTNNSERKTERELQIFETRQAIREFSDKIMKEKGLNIDQQMAMLLFVTIEKVMEAMELSTFTLGCKATSILLEELIHANLVLRK